MGLLDMLRSWRRQGYVVEYRNASAPAVLNYSVERLYREQPALRAVVSFLADNVSSLPIKVYDRAGDTDRRRLTDGPAYGLLMRPNAWTTAHDMTLGTVTDHLLYGWALWYVCKSADLPSGWEATRIPVAWVQDTLTTDGLKPSAYVVQNPDSNRAPVTIAASACVRFVDYDPMGALHPHSPVESLKQVLSEQISAWEFRNGVWGNGGRVQQWISRPLDAKWEPGERDRFAQSWKERYSGNSGTNMGGTPLLEDGMRLETTQFNAREAQWQEATRLAREDVAAVYHVNPSLIWHTDGQTYASAKDNARALYADTLAPLLNMYENVLNAFLLPMVGEEPSHYVEFDLEAKLAGSFEERASVMQSAVGGPWMTRNEARAKLNMPAIDGADDLIVPLNVTEGGLAAPNDTDPTVERHNAAPHFAKAGDAAPFADGAATVVLKSRAVPPEALVDEIADTLARHVRRQVARVTADLAKSAASGAKAVPGDLPEWWDAARWDRELADDLEPILRRIVDQRGMAALADIGEDVSGWDPGRVAAFVRSMAELRARRFNGGTLDAALDVLGGGSGDEAEQVADAILARAEGPAEAAARTYATAASGFATKEAVRQVYPRDTDAVRRTKTWRHHESSHPRSDHAAMDGETVGLDERFSNGADYPGDWTHGPANNVNCHCTMDVGVERRGVIDSQPLDDSQVRTASEVASRLGLGEGYDPQAVHDAYLRCQQTIGQDVREWSGLTLREQQDLLDELRTRDRDWVAYGRPAPVDYSSKPRESLYSHEAKAIDYLSEQHGITLSTILEDDDAVANLDLMIGDYGWELKSPKSGKHAVDDRLTDAFHKFRKLGDNDPRIIICNSESTRPDDDVLDECLRRIRHRKETDQLESIAFLFLSHDGKTLLRYKI